jgi:putative hydrolase of the HAD superfamily
MTAPAVRAVLFDFAGVITGPINVMLHRLAEECGAGVAELSEFLLGDYGGPETPWHRIERGEISLEELYAWGQTAGAARGWDLDLRTFVIGMAEAELRTEVIEAATALRGRGYRTALITNNARELEPVWRPRIPVDDMFDTIVDSSAVGMRKPEPGIFQLTLDRLEVSAPEAVLLDDMPTNIDAARAFGMHAIQVGPESAAALGELDRLLGAA